MSKKGEWRGGKKENRGDPQKLEITAEDVASNIVQRSPGSVATVRGSLDNRNLLYPSVTMLVVAN